MKDNIGKTFNELTVISYSIHSYIQENGRKQTIKTYFCSCSCGIEVYIRSSQLGKQKSCGCARVASNKSRQKDVKGKKFNRLTAISVCQETSEWNCLCDCGEQVKVPLNRLSNANTKSCGCLQKEKASNSMLTKHQDYRESKGLDPNIPISDENRMLRQASKPLAKEILIRDNFTCVWCSKVGGELNAHHLEPWSINLDRRFDKTNLVTLCRQCHLDAHLGNFNSTKVDPIIKILLSGYSNLVEEEKAIASRELISAK